MMVYLQNTKIQPNKKKQFSMQDFVGGLNNRSELLAENDAENILNMAFTNDNVLTKRKGTEAYDAVVLNGEVVFVDEYKPYQEANVLIRATKTKVYAGSTEIQTVVDTITGCNFNGKYYFTDGNGLYVYGKFPQVSDTYTNLIGTPVATYQVFKVISPASGFTPLDTTHTRGKTNYDYILKQISYEPCQFEMEDTHLGANVVPDGIRFLVPHHGRLYVSGAVNDDDNVFISNVRNPYYYPVYLPLQIPPDSDKIKGLVVYDDSVVVGRTRDIYIISGSSNNADISSDLFTLRKLNTHTGFANHTCMSIAHNYLFFIGSDGNAYSLSSTNSDIRVLATSLLNQKIDFFVEPLNYTRADIHTCITAFHNDNWYVSIKDKVLVYNYKVLAWTVYDGWNARSFHKIDDDIIFGKEDGTTAKQSSEYLDFGKPYKALFESKSFDMGTAINYKQFREFFIVIGVFDSFTSDVRITISVDYSDVVDNKEIVSNISRWGMSHFGDRFISRDIMSSSPIMVGRRGRFIRFIFSNGWTPRGTVFAFDDLSSQVGTKSGETLMYVSSEDAYYLYESGIWVKKEMVDLNQPMCVYQINGDYEYRGKR